MKSRDTALVVSCLLVATVACWIGAGLNLCFRVVRWVQQSICRRLEGWMSLEAQLVAAEARAQHARHREWLAKIERGDV